MNTCFPVLGGGDLHNENVCSDTLFSLSLPLCFYEGVPDGIWETWSVRWNGISLIPVRLLPAFVYMECSVNWPLTQDMFWSLWVPKYWVPTFIKPLSKKKKNRARPRCPTASHFLRVCSSWAIARSSGKLNLIKFYHLILSRSWGIHLLLHKEEQRQEVGRGQGRMRTLRPHPQHLAFVVEQRLDPSSCWDLLCLGSTL